MKNLANCNPIEFFVQTNKIRKAAQKWLTLTKIMEIRKKLPEIKEDASKDEQRAALAEQVRKNMGDILDSIMEDHPQETAELLGLMCFIEPSDLKNYKMSDLLGSVNELINSKEVVDFFTSLMQWAKKNTSNIARQ